MSLARIRDLVSTRTGLLPESLGTTALPVAVEARVRVLGAGTAEDYAARLARDPAEFQALVDAIIIPETWFFRGGALYDALVKHVRNRRSAKPFRILSLPCSTGEEPYSVAMALADGGLSPAGWSLDAVDLCSTAIAAAQLGRYREFSFREAPAEARARHFSAVGEQFEIAEGLRKLVQFRVGNLLDAPSWIPEGGRYDCVLCRNLMIYLTPEARRTALDVLDRLLAPDGLLAVGHAEAGNLFGSKFESVGPQGCFLFQRKAGVEPKSELRPRPAPPSGGPRPVEPVSPSGRQRPAPNLVRAAALADAGRIAEALAECRAIVAVAPSADAYCLLGVVLGADGKLDPAGEAFRKALYLDPLHRDALTHGLLIAEAKRDAERAKLYRARLDRLPPPEAEA